MSTFPPNTYHGPVSIGENYSTELPPEDKMPKHLALILDGNGRWASARNLLRLEGHQEGAEVVRNVTRACARWGLRELTLYAFSWENWTRPKAEVEALMVLLADYLVSERDEIMDNNIRLESIGRIDQLPETVQLRLRETEEMSAGNKGMILRLALSYGGRQEIIDGVKRLVEMAKTDPSILDRLEEDGRSLLAYDPNMSEPDLLIRTGGEKRLSNFLLWHLSYTEFQFTDTFWPDYTEEELVQSFWTFAHRERRYGTVR